MTLDEIAQKNMHDRFQDNPHRGIAIGLLPEGRIIQLSWIMGRSENSQNRQYVVEGDIVRTEAVDPSSVQHPELIIYNTMRSTGFPSGSGQVLYLHVVSNGNQTDTVVKALADYHQVRRDPGTSFYAALQSHFCEPDAPIFTPRITGVAESGAEVAHLSMLKADPLAKEDWTRGAAGFQREQFASQEEYFKAVERETGLSRTEFPTQRQFFEMPLHEGYGWCLQTYNPGSKDLSSFTGEPFLVPVGNSLEKAMQGIWTTLNPEWRVALAGKVLPQETGYKPPLVINAHKAHHL